MGGVESLGNLVGDHGEVGIAVRREIASQVGAPIPVADQAHFEWREAGREGGRQGSLEERRHGRILGDPGLVEVEWMYGNTRDVDSPADSGILIPDAVSAGRRSTAPPLPLHDVTGHSLWMSDVAAKPHSLRSNALAIFAGQVATWAITTVTFGLVSRQLGADGFGIWSLSGTFAALAGVFAGLGMTTLIARDVARDPAGSARLISTALWVNLAFGIAAGVISVLAAVAAGYPSSTVTAIALASLTIPFGLVASIVIAAIQGREVMRHAALMDVGFKLLWLVTVLVLAVGFPVCESFPRSRPDIHSPLFAECPE